MTIFFPDVSSYTPNVDPAQYPVLIARATLSDRVSDSTYGTFKAKSAAAGTLFLAYHWLNHGNLPAQAKWAFQHVGPDVPLMIDAEDKAGNTGYNGPLTVDDITGFAAEYRALGGTVSLAYLPFWYWSGAMGAPRRLGELEAAGLHLVSSNYPNAGYTETGPGWAPYYSGAPSPVQWQYTSTPVDMNAFRGTVAEYARMVGGDMELTDGLSIPNYDNDPALPSPVEKTNVGTALGVASQRSWQALQATRRIEAAVTKLTAPADPAAVAAALTPEQLAAAITAAGITPEAVADALAQHFHVS